MICDTSLSDKVELKWGWASINSMSANLCNKVLRKSMYLGGSVNSLLSSSDVSSRWFFSGSSFFVTKTSTTFTSLISYSKENQGLKLRGSKGKIWASKMNGRNFQRHKNVKRRLNSRIPVFYSQAQHQIQKTTKNWIFCFHFCSLRLQQ